MADNEKFYDKEIAPVLLELSRKCQDREIPFIAVVEYNPGEFGRTQFLGNPPDVAMRLNIYAIKSEGNADALINVMIKDAREYGHNSIFLFQLGVPEKPIGNISGTSDKSGETTKS